MKESALGFKEMNAFFKNIIHVDMGVLGLVAVSIQARGILRTHGGYEWCL